MDTWTIKLLDSIRDYRSRLKSRIEDSLENFGYFNIYMNRHLYTFFLCAAQDNENVSNSLVLREWFSLQMEIAFLQNDAYDGLNYNDFPIPWGCDCRFFWRLRMQEF